MKTLSPILLLAALAACGESEPVAEEAPTEAPAEKADAPKENAEMTEKAEAETPAWAAAPCRCGRRARTTPPPPRPASPTR